MGMGFHPKPLVPKHLVALSEGDVCEIRDAFSDSYRSPQSMGDAGYITEGGPALNKMLWDLPDFYKSDAASGPDTLSERGEQALVRMVAGVRIGHTLDFNMPGTTPEQQEELRAALCEEELADAKLIVSLAEGKPGDERNKIVDRRMAAQERLRVAALDYGKAAMTAGGQT